MGIWGLAVPALTRVARVRHALGTVVLVTPQIGIWEALQWGRYCKVIFQYNLLLKRLCFTQWDTMFRKFVLCVQVKISQHEHLLFNQLNDIERFGQVTEWQQSYFGYLLVTFQLTKREQVHHGYLKAWIYHFQIYTKSN